MPSSQALRCALDEAIGLVARHPRLDQGGQRLPG